MELKKDVTIVVLGASGDLAKKKTVLSLLKGPILTIVSRTLRIGKRFRGMRQDANYSFEATYCLPIRLL